MVGVIPRCEECEEEVVDLQGAARMACSNYVFMSMVADVPVSFTPDVRAPKT